MSVGSLFTCAPRLNQMAQNQVVIVVEPHGSYLAVGPEVTQAGVGSVPPSLYREGLTCDDLLAPVAPDTVADFGVPLEQAVEMMPQVGERGPNYLGTVVYSYLNGQPAILDDDGNGWPCEAKYPAEQVSDVQQMVTRR